MLNSPEWIEEYHNSILNSLPRLASNHRPLLINMELYQKKNTPFKFEYIWMTHPYFKEKLKNWWKKKVTGTTMFMFTKKLEEVKKNMKIYNKQMFKKMIMRKLQLKEELEMIEHEILKKD